MPLNIARKEASIVATRTDGEDVRSFNIITALLATTKQKLAAVDDIWSQYLADNARRTAIEAFIGNLEASAKTALEAKEVE